MSTSLWQRWHRNAGITAAVFVILLCVSGIMLNHAETLGLGKRHVATEWLLDWYGIAPRMPPISFAPGSHWVTQIDERLYLDRYEIAEPGGRLIGAVAYQGNMVVALDDQLMILTDAGETIEVLRGTEGVPAGMKAIGTAADGRVVIDAAHGQYLAELETGHWIEGNGAEPAWATAAAPPDELLADLLRTYRGTGLSIERVLVDLHSGRFFGTIGSRVVDLAGVLLLFLAASGAWMWLRRPPD